MKTPKTNPALAVANDALFGLRPCLAEGSPALFHRWMENMQCAVGDGSELYKRTTALVELPDGKMDSVDPYRIQFTDRQNVPALAQSGGEKTPTKESN